ncbi:metal ABC transporter [Janibacter sp. Soil728]|uniref:metal ABC transporter permease n=1 Tax=Janibacter sp. Soil728 TaxID=1736393 RepID=UPI0006F644A3|nr:metal ABC transporter permease [Janibacter sp. Soil728]KRE37954.1 metal ABC transporter [Janibacter sp. Soil728]
MIDILSLEFMRNALLAALLVGASAPLVGVFLVQRGMSLIGDGMGHVALAGVGIGLLTSTSPVLTALVVVVLAAVAIELLRHLGRTGGDLALAVMFYGGLAAGVVIIAKAPTGSATNLQGYLFGALTTVTRSDLVQFAVLAAVVLVTVLVLRDRLFAVAQDEEYAHASGLPVLATNILLAVLTGVTVVISMRVIGLLLISALMILPNATGQYLGRSFRGSLLWAVLVGTLTSVGGVVTSFYADTPSGATIVLMAIAVFVAAACLVTAVRALTRRRHLAAEAHEHVHWEECGHDVVLHGDHVDFLHDGHRHARHGDHWDEHGPDHTDHEDPTLERSHR